MLVAGCRMAARSHGAPVRTLSGCSGPSFAHVPLGKSMNVVLRIRGVGTGPVGDTVDTALVVLGKVAILEVGFHPRFDQILELVVDTLDGVLRNQPFAENMRL